MLYVVQKDIDLHNLKLPQEVVDKLSDTLKEKFGLPITTPTLEGTATLSQDDEQ